MRTFFVTLVGFLFTLNSYAIPNLKIYVSQLKVRAGAISETFAQLKAELDKAESQGAEFFVTPEGIFPGYPSNDMLYNRDFIRQTQMSVNEVQLLSKNYDFPIAIGHVGTNPNRRGRELQNFVSVFYRGELLYRQAKVLLPTYGPFDDARYFEPGRVADIKVLEWKGVRIGFGICEDLWFYDRQNGRLIYRTNPIAKLRALRPDVVISVSASPFHVGKFGERIKVHGDVARKIGAPLIYVNQVGAVDQLIFDGASFALDKSGKLINKLDEFRTDSTTYLVGGKSILSARETSESLSDVELRRQGVVYGLREFVKNINHDAVVFGISGGLDSAMAAYFAAEALGPENVFLIKMPSEISTQDTIEDSDRLIKSLGIPENNILTLQIGDIIRAYNRILNLNGFFMNSQRNTEWGKIAGENLQARSRMVWEFFISNFSGDITSKENHEFVMNMAARDMKWHRFLQLRKAKIATSDKSELALGFGTLFGDIAGVYAVNGDLYKTQLWEIGFHVNAQAGREIIPNAILEKAPTPGLLEGQLTTDRIPPYRIIDPILIDLIENKIPEDELKLRHSHRDAMVHERFLTPTLVDFVLKKHRESEFKRELAQMPTARVSRASFGKERRVTITVKKSDELDFLGQLFCPQNFN